MPAYRYPFAWQVDAEEGRWQGVRGLSRGPGQAVSAGED